MMRSRKTSDNASYRAGKAKNWFAKRMVHRELLFRSRGRVLYIPLPVPAQLLLGALFLVFGSWVLHASYSYFGLREEIEVMDLRVYRAQIENQSLVDEMGQMRAQFADVAGTLEQNHRALARVFGQNSELKNNLERARTKLTRVEQKRREALKRHAALGYQVSELEGQLNEATKRNSELTGTLDNTKSELNTVKGEREAMQSAHGWLKNHITSLEKRVVGLRAMQETLLEHVTRNTVQDIKRVENVIAMTGLKVDVLLGRPDVRTSAQGGPFIPLLSGESKSLSMEDGFEVFDKHMSHLKTVRSLMQSLPLVAPLDYFYITSRFGRRRDPINKKWARHMGLDMAGNIYSRVFAPSPGKVIFVGWKGRFGRTIIIDHGYGVRTRYGHLRRYHVKKGNRVEYRQKIGELGNSGRSTGPHVHFEILFDGKPVDPMKFIKAGKNVFKG